MHTVFQLPPNFISNPGLRLALLLAGAIALVSCGSNDRLVVSVAASLGDAMSEISTEFERDERVHVALNLSGSNALASQVQSGAPIDVVFFAGLSPMARLETSGQVDAASVEAIVENRLVMIGRRGAQAGSFSELLTGSEGKIAIADPGLAPAGAYAVEAMRSAAIYDDVEGRLLPLLDVRSAAAAVKSGGAELGIVYATDAKAFTAVEIVTEIPPELHSPVIYPAAVTLSSSKKEIGKRFVEFLSSEFAKTVLVRHGFIPVD
jgi:molybdate transport system substrate-binding protein